MLPLSPQAASKPRPCAPKVRRSPAASVQPPRDKPRSRQPAKGALVRSL